MLRKKRFLLSVINLSLLFEILNMRSLKGLLN